ncbi:hypothetical protein EYF80_008083 [Liparis tanakae]|uniref:Uncharacterized protein n=1 Tax=Liparis tanakae TaxID=230148 RepID=A0A4Z2IV70_9TELE|nr:hypothetical protein EYF80_008083 [Liparis tanakae]
MVFSMNASSELSFVELLVAALQLRLQILYLLSSRGAILTQFCVEALCLLGPLLSQSLSDRSEPSPVKGLRAAFSSAFTCSALCDSRNGFSLHRRSLRDGRVLGDGLGSPQRRVGRGKIKTLAQPSGSNVMVAVGVSAPLVGWVAVVASDSAAAGIRVQRAD